MWYKWSPTLIAVGNCAQLGFHHAAAGELLCPTQLVWKHEQYLFFKSRVKHLIYLYRVRHDLQNYVIHNDPENFPNMLYLDGTADKEDLFCGFLKHDILLRVRTLFFFQPLNSNRGTSRGGFMFSMDHLQLLIPRAPRAAALVMLTSTISIKLISLPSHTLLPLYVVHSSL